MKKAADINKKELGFSLFFPIITFLWGIARLATDYFLAGKMLAFSGLRAAILFPYLAGILGGILSASFTIFFAYKYKQLFPQKVGCCWNCMRDKPSSFEY